MKTLDAAGDSSRRFRWLPVAIWMGAIYFVSSQSTAPLPGIDWLDELIRIVGHFVQYAVLGFLVARAVMRGSEWSAKRVAFVLIWCAVYAVSDEWHQRFVPGRSSDVKDWLVDSVGALAGYAMCFRVRHSPDRLRRSIGSESQ